MNRRSFIVRLLMLIGYSVVGGKLIQEDSLPTTDSISTVKPDNYYDYLKYLPDNHIIKDGFITMINKNKHIIRVAII